MALTSEQQTKLDALQKEFAEAKQIADELKELIANSNTIISGMMHIANTLRTVIAKMDKAEKALQELEVELQA